MPAQLGDFILPVVASLGTATSSGRIVRLSTDGEAYEDALDGSGWRLHRAAPGTLLAGRFGYLGWSTDPDNITAANAPTSGTIQFSLVFAGKSIPSGTSLSIAHSISVKVTTPTAGQNLVGLYKLTGSTLTLLGTSGDMSTTWGTANSTSTMLYNATITTNAAIYVNDALYVAFLCVATTPATFRGSPSSFFANLGPIYRRLSLVSQTSLPSSITYSSLNAQNLLEFGAIVY